MSGAWFPAREVMIACNLRLTRYLGDWRHRRERDISLLQDRGRWSWSQWKQVPLTYAEAEAESMTVRVIDFMIEAPMNHDGYAAVSNLLSLAAQAEKLQAGSQVFVSAADHARISGSLQGVLTNERSASRVSRNRGHHNGDGEPGS